jgi:hypothetical protein
MNVNLHVGMQASAPGAAPRPVQPTVALVGTPAPGSVAPASEAPLPAAIATAGGPYGAILYTEPGVCPNRPIPQIPAEKHEASLTPPANAVASYQDLLGENGMFTMGYNPIELGGEYCVSQDSLLKVVMGGVVLFSTAAGTCVLPPTKVDGSPCCTLFAWQSNSEGLYTDNCSMQYASRRLDKRSTAYRRQITFENSVLRFNSSRVRKGAIALSMLESGVTSVVTSSFACKSRDKFRRKVLWEFSHFSSAKFWKRCRVDIPRGLVAGFYCWWWGDPLRALEVDIPPCVMYGDPSNALTASCLRRDASPKGPLVPMQRIVEYHDEGL